MELDTDFWASGLSHRMKFTVYKSPSRFTDDAEMVDQASLAVDVLVLWKAGFKPAFQRREGGIGQYTSPGHDARGDHLLLELAIEQDGLDERVGGVISRCRTAAMAARSKT